jgi:hypothetical protein
MISIDAQIVDAVTGQGIPAATIAVNGTPVGSTDEDGGFQIMVNSYSDTITASSVGYTTLTQSAATVQEAGEMRLPIDAQSLQAATVTAVKKKNYWPWLILGGVVVVGSQQRRKQAISGKGSALVPIALVGAGALLLLQRKTSALPAGSTAVAPYAPTSAQTPSLSSIFSGGGLSTISDIFKGIFGGSSPSFTPVNTANTGGGYTDPASAYPTLPTTAPSIPIFGSGSSDTAMDPSDYGITAGIGATTTLNAGDIIGKTLVAAEKVPVYDTPADSAQPSGYITQGNPIGIVYSYLNPDPTQDRTELWWMFEPLPGNSDIGDNLGYYYVPHNPAYFDTQALLDAGVLTVAQATALKQGTGDSVIDTYIKKYGPYVLGAFVLAAVGKAVINKTL